MLKENFVKYALTPEDADFVPLLLIVITSAKSERTKLMIFSKMMAYVSNVRIAGFPVTIVLVTTTVTITVKNMSKLLFVFSVNQIW